MLLTPHNSTNPSLWGKVMKQDGNRFVVEDIQIPKEIDFIKEFYNKDISGAKEYFKAYLNNN